MATGGFAPTICAFERAQLARNYAENTVLRRSELLRQFAAWCDERALTAPGEITRPMLEAYRAHLYLRRKKNGQPLSFSTQVMHLGALRAFFRWLTRDGYIAANPASELDLPRREHRVPRDVFTVDEVEAVLRQPNVLDPCGLRDRAILEVFYSTGMRRSELRSLSVWDVDWSRGTVFIRLGKGKKDRVVPIGERALHWVARYRDEVRPLLVQGGNPAEEHLFLALSGGQLENTTLGQLVTRYIASADVGKRGGCHLFRHTCATLMLEGGADIRYVQEQLGHAKLESTQVYTRVAITKLLQVHRATHPAAFLAQPEADGAELADAG